jgi:Sec-independent protein translocase protein TatA
MLPSITELILLIFIVICIFGSGKIGAISEALGERRARRQQELPPDDAIDITPEQQPKARAAANPKPGTRESSVDEADVDDSGVDKA